MEAEWRLQQPLLFLPLLSLSIALRKFLQSLRLYMTHKKPPHDEEDDDFFDVVRGRQPPSSNSFFPYIKHHIKAFMASLFLDDDMQLLTQVTTIFPLASWSKMVKVVGGR